MLDQSFFRYKQDWIECRTGLDPENIGLDEDCKNFQSVQL